MAQIKSRAPNSSQAYVSTESRLPAFEKLFKNPLALGDLATKHSDLQSTHDLATAVAQLVGGRDCRAARDVKHTDLIAILYHSEFKFSRGATTKMVLPLSKAEKLRREKPPGMIVLHLPFASFCCFALHMKEIELAISELLMDDNETMNDALSE